MKPMLLFVVAVMVAGCASIDVANHRLAPTGEEMQRPAAGAERDAELDRLLVEPLDADAAVRVALLANPRVQALFDTLEIGEAQRVQAIRPRNPLLEIETGFRGGSLTELEFTLVQPLLDLVQYSPRRRRADAEFDAVTHEATGEILRFIAEVRHAWVDAVAAGQREFQAGNDTEAAEAALEFMQTLYDAGNVTGLALARTRARHHDAVLALGTARAERQANRERLGLLLGLVGDDRAWSLRPRLPDPPDGPDAADDAVELALDNSLGLAAERRRLDALAADAGIADSSAWLTKLDVGLRAERDAGDWSGGPLVEFPLPLFDTGSARRAEAHARLARATHEYGERTIATRADARRLVAVTGHARAGAELYRDAKLPAHAELMDQAMRQHNAMNLSVFELLDARRAQVDAWRGYIDALAAYWHARIELDALLAGVGRSPGGR